MNKILIVLTLLLQSYALTAGIPALNKNEVELKVALTKEGHKALKAAFIAHDYKLEESQRSDYYFDIYHEGRYILRDLPRPVKLRMMWDGDELKWQNQAVIRTSTHSIFSIKTTESSEIEMNSEPELMRLIESYFKKLTVKDLKAIAMAETIQAALVEKNILEHSGDHYYPAHSNHKKRVKLKLKLGQDQFSVQLGETDNRGVLTYELEAELKKITDQHKSAERLNLWLQSLGFNNSYIDISVQTDPSEWSEKILNELFVFGVQNF